VYPTAVVLRNERADSASVVNGLGQATLFHFAGHAVFDDVEPERSYIALGSRGLTPMTISSLQLGQLDLVTLSACETLRSMQTNGAGFLGLADAFLAAGAHGVIASAWRVEDRATSRLMEGFYRAYRGGVGGASALRRAQIELLTAGASPAEWSGFTYSGF